MADKVDTKKVDFVNLFALFYERFFSATADSVELLAQLQKEYKEEYESIKLFSKDPDAIENLIEELPQEKQALLLKILLRAGKFGRDLAILFESNEEEKKILADNLRKFAKDLAQEMKKEAKEEAGEEN